MVSNLHVMLGHEPLKGVVLGLHLAQPLLELQAFALPPVDLAVSADW